MPSWLIPDHLSANGIAVLVVIALVVFKAIDTYFEKGPK